MGKLSRECMDVFREPPSLNQVAAGGNLEAANSSQIGGDDNSWVIAGQNQKVVSSGRVTLKAGSTGLGLPGAVFEADGASVSFIMKGAEITAKAGATVFADTEAKVSGDGNVTRVKDLTCRVDDLEPHKDDD